MEDFENKIKEFEEAAKKVEETRFEKFEELETEFCKVLNEGTALRNYLKDNPQLCSENTYKYLTNQTLDPTVIEDKYKFLAQIIEVKKILLKHYENYLAFLIKNKNFNLAIRIYNQMFAFTGNYFYKKEIANIYLKIYKDYDKCFSMYKEAEPYLEKMPHFWWEFSEVYLDGKDNYNQLLCVQKAVNLEMEKLNK